MNLTNAAVCIETTGLISGLNEVVQLSIVTYDNAFSFNDRFNMSIRPMRPEFIDEDVLKINKETLKYMSEQAIPAQVKHALYEWLDDRTIYPLGFNYNFDRDFLKLFLGDKYDEIFFYKYRDTCIIADYLKDKGKIKLELENLSLISLSDYFNILCDEHNSLSNCITTIRLYEKLLKI